MPLNKAIILTNAEVTDMEKLMLQETDILKVAINQHANELCPTLRFTSDHIVDFLKTKFPQPIMTARVNHRDCTMVLTETQGSSLADCIKWLDTLKVKEILLVANNSEYHENFKDLVQKIIRGKNYSSKVYKYEEDGYFDLPYKSIEDFTREEIL